MDSIVQDSVTSQHAGPSGNVDHLVLYQGGHAIKGMKQ